MAYLYRYWRKDLNEPFYIGIGEDSYRKQKYYRAHTKDNRNFHFLNIINKAPYIVQILMEDLSWNDACLMEIEWIKFYGRKDRNLGPLVNMTDGGEGFKSKHKPTTIDKMRKPKSLEHKLNLKISKLGKPNPSRHLPVSQSSKDGILLKKYTNIHEASSITGVSVHSISNNINGWSKSAGGFVWNKI